MITLTMRIKQDVDVAMREEGHVKIQGFKVCEEKRKVQILCGRQSKK